LDRQTNGTALTVGASVIWGTSFVAVSVGLQYSNPYVLLFERFLVATVAIMALGIFIRPARVWPQLRKPGTWAVSAVYAAAFLLNFLGQDVSGASASALLSNMFVVFVPVMAFFVLKERMSNPSKAAVALSVVGMALVFPAGLQLTGKTVGDLLLVGSALGYTFFIVVGKKYGISSLASSFALIVSMTAITAPLAFIEGGPSSFISLGTMGDWVSVLWLAVPCTVVALAMYTRGLASIGATQSATLLLLEIIVGVGLSVALLGDVFSLYQVLGASVIGAAVLLSSTRPAPPLPQNGGVKS
jgi:drug/metabolite transporter (DMT)-like permease